MPTSGSEQPLGGHPAGDHQRDSRRTSWSGSASPPWVAPVAVGLIFSKMFADQSGLVNTLLGSVGIDPIRWHADVLSSHVAIATMVNFRWTGYTTLILLAAMQAVPGDLYEAAVIDGASRARQFFSVTVPMLRPTIIFVVITSTIGGLQIFDEPRILAGVTLATIPLIIVFTLAGKQLVSGIMQGAVKG